MDHRKIDIEQNDVPWNYYHSNLSINEVNHYSINTNGLCGDSYSSKHNYELVSSGEPSRNLQFINNDSDKNAYKTESTTSSAKVKLVPEVPEKKGSDNSFTTMKKTTIKPMHCKVCDKKFTQKISLANHERSHGVRNPHVCGFCGERFKYKTNLTRHQRKHARELHICRYCHLTLSTDYALVQHEKAHRLTMKTQTSFNSSINFNVQNKPS